MYDIQTNITFKKHEKSLVTLKILLNSYILPGKLASDQSQSALVTVAMGGSLKPRVETSLGKTLNPVSNKTQAQNLVRGRLAV